jgi:hypothetical protein
MTSALGEDKVQPSLVQPTEKIATHADLGRQVDFGVAAKKTDHRCRQACGGEVLRQSQPHVTAEGPCAKFLHRFAHEIEDARGIILKRLAVPRERHGSSVAFEQLFADYILKSADLLPDGGATDARARRRVRSSSFALSLRSCDEDRG